MDADFIRVDVKASSGETKSDVHMHVFPRKEVLERQPKPGGIPLDVALIMFDSTSAANFRRKMPNSLEYLTKNLDSLLLQGELTCNVVEPSITDSSRRQIQYRAKVLQANFDEIPRFSTKDRPFFQRIIALHAGNVQANLRRKFERTKNEICAFCLHYFCTILYIVMVPVCYRETPLLNGHFYGLNDIHAREV